MRIPGPLQNSGTTTAGPVQPSAFANARALAGAAERGRQSPAGPAATPQRCPVDTSGYCPQSSSLNLRILVKQTCLRKRSLAKLTQEETESRTVQTTGEVLVQQHAAREARFYEPGRFQSKTPETLQDHAVPFFQMPRGTGARCPASQRLGAARKGRENGHVGGRKKCCHLHTTPSKHNT